VRIGIIGGGVIARLILEHLARGELGEFEVCAILGRSAASRGKPLAEAYGVPFVQSLRELLDQRPDAVVEAASHDAVREFAAPLLECGIAVIVLSGGALATTHCGPAGAAGGRLIRAPPGSGARRAEGGLRAGPTKPRSQSPPPAAWKEIPAVDAWDRPGLLGRDELFDGSARRRRTSRRT
jgi:aspartate dehydrogenase